MNNFLVIKIGDESPVYRAVPIVATKGVNGELYHGVLCTFGDVIIRHEDKMPAYDYSVIYPKNNYLLSLRLCFFKLTNLFDYELVPIYNGDMHKVIDGFGKADLTVRVLDFNMNEQKLEHGKKFNIPMQLIKPYENSAVAQCVIRKTAMMDFYCFELLQRDANPGENAWVEVDELFPNLVAIDKHDNVDIESFLSSLKNFFEPKIKFNYKTTHKNKCLRTTKIEI